MTSNKMQLALEAKQVTAACAIVTAMAVTTQADVDALAAGLIEAAARLKFLEAGRLAKTTPLEAELKTIRDETRAPEAAYKELKTAISNRITRYNQEARALEDAARARALATQEQAHAAAAVGNLPQASALQSQAYRALAAAPPVLETEGTHTRREWRIRVTNKALVNPMWMIVDEAGLTAHARKVLPKAAPGADVSAWSVNGVEVYLHEQEVVTGR